MTEKDLINNLAELIFLHRKKNRISLQELSNTTKITPKSLRLLELGKNNPTLAAYFLAAKNLAIPPQEIIRVLENFFKQ